MSLLYKEEKDLIYKVAFKELPSGEIEISFTCDGGKFGTEEGLAEYVMTPKDLLIALLRNRVVAKHLDE